MVYIWLVFTYAVLVLFGTISIDMNGTENMYLSPDGEYFKNLSRRFIPYIWVTVLFNHTRKHYFKDD